MFFVIPGQLEILELAVFSYCSVLWQWIFEIPVNAIRLAND
jgi:hypothetical protein